MSGKEVARLLSIIRKKLRPREDHHHNCDSRQKKRCDCYASLDLKAHEALDKLGLAALDPATPKKLAKALASKV